MEYGIIYIKVCPPKGHNAEWLKYCQIFTSIPKSLQNNIIDIVKNINLKYSDDLVIPMDIDLHPGCTTTVESVEVIANEMYSEYCEMMERQGLDVECVRCLYSVGELSTVDTDSTHNLRPDDVMVNLGRTLDSSDEPGIFKV
jgi:hypothetical protein